jgi:hypothetical protein
MSLYRPDEFVLTMALSVLCQTYISMSRYLKFANLSTFSIIMLSCYFHYDLFEFDVYMISAIYGILCYVIISVLQRLLKLH